MPNEEEILRFKFDLTDVEAKVKRLQQLLEEIKAKRAAGEDVSKLEVQFNKELDGLSAVTRKQEQASTSTQDLIKQKEKLANVVQLVGGRFSGMIGALGGVVELLLAGGRAAIGLGAALIGLTAGIAVIQKIRDAAKEATEHQERFNEAASKMQFAKLGPTAQMGEVLRRFGARPEAEAPAKALYDRLGAHWGMVKPELAALATAAGITSAEELAAVAMFAAKERVDITRPEQVREVRLGNGQKT